MSQTEMTVTSTESKVLQLDVADIIIEDNIRQDVDKEGLSELASSIREVGMLQPICVVDRGDGSYSLKFGQRRLLAAIKIGLDTVPAIVLDADDVKTENSAVVGLTENLARQDMNSHDVARGICIALGLWNQEEERENTKDERKEFQNRTGGKLTASQLAQRLGQSEGYISQHKTAFLSVTDTFRAAWKKNPDGWSFAKVRDTVRNLPPEIQNALATDSAAVALSPSALENYCRTLIEQDDDDGQTPSQPAKRPRNKTVGLLPKAEVFQRYRELEQKYTNSIETFSDDYDGEFDPNDPNVPEAHKAYWKLQGMQSCLNGLPVFKEKKQKKQKEEEGE